MKWSTILGLSVLLVGLSSFTSLVAKIVYQLEGVGRDGQQKLFEKPWALTAVMYFSMALCLPLAYLLELAQQRRHVRPPPGEEAFDDEDGDIVEPLLGVEDSTVSVAVPGPLAGLRKATVLIVPTALDLVATALMNIGLLHLTVSVYQMLRGASELIFARLFAAAVLKRRPSALHLVGTACCVVGMALVGAASLFSGEGLPGHPETRSHKLLGMGLVMLSQGVQTAQIRYKDYFMADLPLTPLRIVGYEGLFGSIGSLFLVLPLAQLLPGEEGQGVHEDSLDTLHMLAHSPAIAGILLADVVALLLHNVAGMRVADRIGPVFRTVLEQVRTLLVWLGALLLFYLAAASGRLGEPWVPYSWLQLAGFVALVSGTLLYSKGDERRVQEQMEEEEELYAQEEEEGKQAAALPGVSSAEEGLLGATPQLQRQESLPISIYAMPASVPIAVSATSFKSSMNLTAFNLPRPFSERAAEERAADDISGTTPRPTWAMMRKNLRHPRRGKSRRGPGL